jgi:hypothetical protein
MRPWARLLMLAALLVDLVAVGTNLSKGSAWGVGINLVSATVVLLIWRWGERRAKHWRQATKLLLDSIDAPRPEGVRIRRADGTEQAVELVYRGTVDDGYGPQHLWEVAGMELQPGDELMADVMPGRTGIEWKQAKE